MVGEHDHKVFSATLEPEPRLLDQADVRGVLSVLVQSDRRPVGALDVHATSRGLVGRS